MSLRLARPLAGLITCGALVALPAGASQAATPSTKLQSLSSPPTTTLAPGAGLTVSGRLTNRTRRNAKARVTLTLQSRKRGVRAISIGGKSSSRIKAGRTARFRLSVKLPAGLAGGSYYLRACARIAPGKADCRFAKRKLKVAAKPTTQTPATQPTPRAHVPADVPAPGPAHAAARRHAQA